MPCNTKVCFLPFVSHAADWGLEDEGQDKLVARIMGKLSLGKEEFTAITERKDGAGLVYEFEGGRYSLDDGTSSWHGALTARSRADVM